jgi:O-succinylbenzoate synthase
MLMAVRDRYPIETIHADVEGGLSLDHSDLLYRFDDFMLAFVEQPLPAEEMVGHAMLQEAIHTPLGLDESITSPSQAEIALDLKAGRYFNLKCAQVGGLTPALEILRACQANEVQAYAGAELQTSIGMRFTAALALMESCDYPADWIPDEPLLAEDPGIPLATERCEEKNEKGEIGAVRVIRPWKEPGIGFDPDAELIEKSAVERFSIEPGRA